MSVSIIRATISDADALAEIGVSTFVETFGHLYSEQDLQQFLDENHRPSIYAQLLASPAVAFWLAYADGTLAGYIGVGPSSLPVPDQPENAGELKRLYVSADYQGTGLAQAMMVHALGFLEANFNELYLSVYADNPRAQRFYARYGFQKFHEYTFMVGNHGDPEWIMRREMPSSQQSDRHGVL